MVEFLLSLVLTVFVLVAVGQLFSIKRSLRRLVELAESERLTVIGEVPAPQAGSTMAKREFDPEKARRAWNCADSETRRRMLQHAGVEDPSDTWLRLSYEEMLHQLELSRSK